MSPTFAEVTVGLIAVTFVFLFMVRVTPLIIDRLARFLDRSLDNKPSADTEERERNHYER